MRGLALIPHNWFNLWRSLILFQWIFLTMLMFSYRVVTALRGLIISLLATTLPLALPLFKSLILLLISLITIPSPVSLITQFVVPLIWCLLWSLNSPLVQPGIMLMVLTFRISVIWFLIPYLLYPLILSYILTPLTLNITHLLNFTAQLFSVVFLMLLD